MRWSHVTAAGMVTLWASIHGLSCGGRVQSGASSLGAGGHSELGGAAQSGSASGAGGADATDATGATGSASTEVPLPGSPEAAVATFENALAQSCRCIEGCVRSWSDQFGSTSRECLASILRDLDLVDCVGAGSSKVLACLLATDCSMSQPRCDTSLLTEDTPLTDLVERYCGGRQGQDYWAALKAADSCQE